MPERRKEKARPHGHAVAEPESLPITCDYLQNPAVRLFELDIEPPSLDDQTADFDRLRRALQQQHGIEELRAELPELAHLGTALRHANWRVTVALEMRDWVYGSYLPPRLLRVYPTAFPQASMGLAVDLGTTGVVAYLLDFPSGRVVDSAGAYNKQIACGEDVISRIIYAKRKGGLERLQKLAIETINDLRRRAAASATASSRARSTRWPSPATRRWSTCCSAWSRATCARSRTSRPSARRPSSSPRSWGST